MKKRTLALLTSFITCLSIQAQTFDWAKSIGSTNDDQANSITTDSKGNVYTVGSFSGIADFDPGIGVVNLSTNGTDAFVSKLDKNGDFLWVKQIGDAVGYNSSWSITVDASENILMTGFFHGSVNFNTNSSPYFLTANVNDAFILKLDTLGSFIWVKQLKSSDGGSFIYSITTDSQNNVYTTGSFNGTTDFDPGINTLDLINDTLTPNGDVFISKLNSNGEFIWAKQFVGGFGYFSTENTGFSIKIDKFQNVYTTGWFSDSVDFDPGTNKYILEAFDSANASSNVFISKLDVNGDFIWAKQFVSGRIFNFGNSLTLDHSGNIYSTGTTLGSVDMDPGTNQYMLYSSTPNIYISKLNNDGEFLWAHQFGGLSNSNIEAGFGVDIDSLNNMYVTGWFSDTTNFDTGLGTYNLVSDSTFVSGFLAKYDSLGNFIFANKIAGNGNLQSYSIKVNDNGKTIYLAGRFENTCDFNPSNTNYNLVSQGKTDIFILKLSTIVPIVNFDKKTVLNLSIIPNPSNGAFTISNLEQGSYTLLNELGQTVRTFTPNNTTANITGLTNGVYILQSQVNPTRTKIVVME